jgi:hypothetical protein
MAVVINTMFPLLYSWNSLFGGERMIAPQAEPGDANQK